MTNNSQKLVKQVIVLRKDLNMRKGKMAAQASHASMEFLLSSYRSEPGIVVEQVLSQEQIEWLATGTKKVVVGCNSEEELDELFRKAKKIGLTVHMVVDSGFTEFNGIPTKTCIAIGPHANGKIDPLTGELSLL